MEQSKDKRTFGERLLAIRAQAEAEEFIDTAEVVEVLTSYQNHVGDQRLFGIPVHQEDLDDMQYLRSLLPSDPNQAQFGQSRD